MMMMMMMIMIKNFYCSLCKVPVISVTFHLKFYILDRFGKNTQPNLMKICPVVAELLHVDRATGRWGDGATGRRGDRATGRQRETGRQGDREREGDRTTDRQRDRQTGINKLIVAFRNFAKKSKIFPRYT